MDMKEKLKFVCLKARRDSEEYNEEEYLSLINEVEKYYSNLYDDVVFENLNSAPKGAKTNKDLEVSASPTPKVCPVCKSNNLKLMLKNGFRCLDCNSQGHLGKPSLNPDIRRNSDTPLKSMEQLK